MTTARAITQSLAAKGIQRSSPKAIYLVLTDEHHTVCYTEPDLDTWFSSLTPEEKAHLCELHHDGPPEFHSGGPSIEAIDMQTAALRRLPAIAPFVDALALMDQARSIVANVHHLTIDRSEAPDVF
jgi:hypothetical protein